MSVISQKQVDPLQHHTTQIKDELQTTQQKIMVNTVEHG